MSGRKFYSTSRFPLEEVLNFPVGCGTCPHTQKYQYLLWQPLHHCVWQASKLIWPKYLKKIFFNFLRERWDATGPTMQKKWKANINQNVLTISEEPQADHLHAIPHWCSKSCRLHIQELIAYDYVRKSLFYWCCVKVLIFYSLRDASAMIDFFSGFIS